MLSSRAKEGFRHVIKKTVDLFRWFFVCLEPKSGRPATFRFQTVFNFYNFYVFTPLRFYFLSPTPSQILNPSSAPCFLIKESLF